MARKLTIEEVKERIKKVHGDVVILDESTYVNTHTKARFIDKDYGGWWAIPSNVIFNKQGHLKRGIEKQKKSSTLSVETTKQKIYNIHGDIIVLDESTYKNINTKCRFVDKDYGEFWSIPNSVIGRSHGHPKRGIEKQKKSSTLSIETIKQRLYKIYEDLMILDDSTYINTKTKCRFIDKDYGEFWTTANKIFCRGEGHPGRRNERREQTCLKKYGVKHTSQNPEIALKIAKAQNNSFILNHWKTNEEIVCVAGYEKKVVEYFNKNKINFKWQHKTFKMPDGKTFRPDCYLIGKRKPWIEIKGYFRGDAKEKWEWFHKKHPNSELWDQKKLKKMKIL